MQHERERQEWQAQIFRYQLLCHQHHIELDGDDPLVSANAMEMYQASKEVVRAAGELLAAMKALEKVYGTSMELVGSWDRD